MFVFFSLSGVSDYFANDEAESFEMLRDSVATLNITPPVQEPEGSDPLHCSADLDGRYWVWKN